MGAEIDNYIAKLKEFDQAKRARDFLIKYVVTAAAGMERQPDLFHFSNTPGGFPPEVIMSRAAPSVDGNQWPTAERIQNSLVLWHQAKQALLNAWDGIPESDRAALQPPPWRR